MRRIKITYGGSHRKNARDYQKLKPFIEPGSLIMPTSMGGKRLETVAFDSPELREVLKAIGGTVKRHQPNWLNK